MVIVTTSEIESPTFIIPPLITLAYHPLNPSFLPKTSMKYLHLITLSLAEIRDGSLIYGNLHRFAQGSIGSVISTTTSFKIALLSPLLPASFLEVNLYLPPTRKKLKSTPSINIFSPKSPKANVDDLAPTKLKKLDS